MLAERLPLRQQQDLHRVAAQLSALIADELTVLGKPVHASSWHELAARLADEAGDDALRGQVRALAAMLPLYYGDPSSAVQLARQAQEILPGRRHAAAALAPALEAFACAQLGDTGSA